ncbi:uncharacterized protein KY384_005345 [Bacidia gigantensis]|uniref:uncharacterized protein n=1 Tax=Bacidia gigantensis TaxID=2732470 RepID=UPI001D04A1F3|nr:uncharacterized protein KY384_005345 [Bacidia gigantensis]KAG8529864.1 hypothetical protein KY384_005345 [Bacidia gigantensis]
MAAAVISLTYTVDDGSDFKGTYLRNGQATVSNITCYLHGRNSPCDNEVTTSALAHAYGEDTLGPDDTSGLQCGGYSDLASVINSKSNFRYYCRRNTTIQEFAYRFNEYNEHDEQQAYPHFTDRVITASSGTCNEYNQTNFDNTGHIGTDNSDDDSNFISSIRYTYSNDSTNRNGSINIPTSALGNEGTTYIFRGPEAPKDAKTNGYACGDRCIWMWAYKNPSSSNDDPGHRFYACPITVSLVSNVKNPQHNITNDVARQAAASIALQGQFHAGAGTPFDWTQWQWYASG